MGLKKLNLLVCTSIFPNQEEPARGIYILHQARALATFCNVRIIAPVPYFPTWLNCRSYKALGRIPRREEIGGLDVLHPRVLVIPKVGWPLSGLTYLASIWRLVSSLWTTFLPDILISYWIYPDAFACTWLGNARGIPVIVGGLGCDLNNVAPSGVHGRMVRATLRRASRIMVVSEAMKQRGVECGITPEKIAVIPNGLDNAFQPVEKETARRLAGLPTTGSKGTTILYCGRLSSEKGLEYLLEAAKILKDKAIAFHLLIVGQGPLRNPLEALADRLGVRDRVKFAGEVPPERIPMIMNSSDLLCLPSLREGWPNVVMEALGCGIPVVASDVGGIPEMLRSREYGIMVRAADPTALASALEQALTKDWKPYTVREAVKGRTWDDVAVEIMNQVDRVLAR